jgi:trehalose synthase
MARRKTLVNEVDVGSAPIERFQPLLTPEVWSELERDMGLLAKALQGHSVWNVNSTARGGGVAELLAALIPYDRGVGIDERWAVMEGSPAFFAATKKIHTLLHGVEPRDGRLTEDERHHYEQATARNAEALIGMIRPGDVAILHDPQTVGCVPALAERGIHVIWRSHIGVDEPNGAVRDAWSFLAPYLSGASALVFSRRAYVWDDLDESRVHIIAPCIDPFATKNQDFVAGSMNAILRAGGLLSTHDGQAGFMRHDGTPARVVHSAIIDGATLPDEARIVTQVSRWDRLKDPGGVLESFAQYIAPRSDAYLVLAGPAASSVTDDPEQPEVLRELKSRRDAMTRDVRDRIVIAQLPMEDTDENAAIVNALQRRADVVVQKSLVEGFGLTVAEAMWKGRPVVASRVGGIEDQVEDGKSGILVDDPKDLEAFGSAVVRVLGDQSLAGELGHEARRRVIRKFITPCHLIEQARLVISLVGR